MVISIDEATEEAYRRVDAVLTSLEIEFTREREKYSLPDLKVLYREVSKEVDRVLRGTPYFVRLNIENSSFEVAFWFRRNIT